MRADNPVLVPIFAAMFTIENQHMKAMLASRGAELQQLFSKEYQLEYLWNGDPAFWAKHSPVLFPVVGALKEDIYYYDGKMFRLSRHGFARDMEFSVVTQRFDEIIFQLKSSSRSLEVYPFEFELQIGYRLENEWLRVTYHVLNTGMGDLYFSIGAHPAFNLPLAGGTQYSDYFLEFNEEETLPRWPISKEGLIENHPVPLLKQTQTLSLSKELFYGDALVFKFPASSEVTLRSEKTERGLDLDFSGFPYLGIWAAKNANFLCIEPWCGIADSVVSDQQLIHKEGIEKLGAGGVFERSWSVRPF
jgi:galactose mutarotase-like enzyme